MQPDAIVALLADLIASLGFPIAVAAFLLWERRTTHKQLIEAIQALKTAIDVLTATHAFDRTPGG